MVTFDSFTPQNRVLGIRLDKFDLKQKKGDLKNTPIEVCVYNVNGTVLGGCTVYYAPKLVNKRWTVECYGIIDP